METLKLAMIGFGNAGKAFSKIILQRQEEIIKTFEVKILTTAIATATRGNLVNEKGIDLGRTLCELEQEEHFDESWSAYSKLTSREIIEKADYDVLIEITTLNIFTGQPAIDNIKLALGRKKHVITANKGPIAWAYKELKLLSKVQGASFLFETTVMDGTPVFNMVEETLPMCKILQFNGILNTTTNFVLEEMAKGKTLDEAVEDGKARGFVEADPKLDIEGFDAAAKTAALINVLMDGSITPLDINREGIQHVTYEDIVKTRNENKLIKLICHGAIKDGKIIGEVKPVEIDKEHIFATVKGTSSILSLETDLMGEVTIVEHSPEIEQTGYGLFSDLLRLLRKLIVSSSIYSSQKPESSHLEQINIKIVEYDLIYAADTVRMWRQSKESAIGQKELHSFENHVYFLNHILKKDNKIYIAIDKNKVVGILAFNENEINQLYIHNDYQGKGLGKRFLDISKVNSNGRLTLYTFEVNHKAQQFYENNGFKIIGRGNDNEEKLDDIKYEWVECSDNREEDK